MGLYALSRPRSNLDSILPLNSLFNFLNQRILPFPTIFVIVFVMAKKSEDSYLSFCVTNGEQYFTQLTEMAISAETYDVWKTNQSKLSMKSFLDSDNAKK